MAEPTSSDDTQTAPDNSAPEEVTDEQVQQMQDEVDRLRQEAADAEEARRTAQAAQNNLIQYRRLEAEAARLRLDIDRTNALTDQATSDQIGVAAPLAAATASMEAAVAAQQAQQDLVQADQEQAAAAASDAEAAAGDQTEDDAAAAVSSDDTGGTAEAGQATVAPTPTPTPSNE